MSFYRSVLAAVAALAIASPVLADDITPASTSTAPAAQSTDVNAAQPVATDTSAQNSATDANTTAAATVDLNKASYKELMKVKGVNASKARAIVAYRKKHGDFKTVQTLAKVKGFSKMKDADIKAIESQLSVN